MLKRKISSELQEFKAMRPKTALLLTGAPQVGKTYIVREFARESYGCCFKINFINQPDA